MASSTRVLGLVVALLLLLPTLLGCASSEAEPYKIGALFAVSGNNSPLGTPEKETALLLEEQINAKGGIKGRKVKVIAYDTESDETKAVTLAKRLIEQDNVLAIIGPSSTGESLALIDTVEKAQVPLISCAASAKITSPVKPYVFKTAQSDALAVGEVFDYLKAKGLTKIALLTTTSGFGTTGKEAIEAALPGSGLQVVAAETFGDKDTDMTVQLTKIRGANPQALVVWGTNPGPAIIAKNVKQLGLNLPIVNSHGVANAKFIELAGEAANGVVFPAGKLSVAKDLPDSDPQKALLLAYDKDFQAKYKKSADGFGGYAYDALQLLVKAIEGGAETRAQLRAALEGTKGLVGVSGTFNMSAQDHNGLSKGAFVIVRVKDGQWAWEK
ncbi:MAG: ABC transporter substrate-binding protein [Chloroflexota bacterium]